jgi:hypothetical protein
MGHESLTDLEDVVGKVRGGYDESNPGYARSTRHIEAGESDSDIFNWLVCLLNAPCH